MNSAPDGARRAVGCGRLAPMTTGPEDPQPRDIAVEQESAEVEADLEAQSEPDGQPSGES
ncbi:hypothetical protein SAMN06272739_3957 [Blastococcus haudaquaticus]|uniref:Uncharacterized protein n=1 Tax=Blastococcus haudaquaticus TaxID=1938745 RepID=A0A286H6B4_9ACTN|nr:hypothetical protein SAMN06272739_3957 [Blastococcus haudaquaticus]